MYDLKQSQATYIYDGTLEGFFSLVFDAFARHERPESITTSADCQLTLTGELREVQCDIASAERVKVGICNKLSYSTYRKIKMAFLSWKEGREQKVFDFISLGMSSGMRALSDPSNEVVANVDALAFSVSRELERMRQFARFEKLENGIYLAVINPDANLLPLLMGHFANRFAGQAFAIYDETHHVAGLHDGNRQLLFDSVCLQKARRCEREALYQAMWKTFYDTVSNSQRINLDLRRAMMPQKYWRNLTEMRAKTVATADM